MKVDFIQSPNYTQGRGGQSIRGVVLHRMAGTYSGSIQWFKNPKAQASSQYLVGPNGEVTQMVRNEDTSWASGISWLNGQAGYYANGKFYTFDQNKVGQFIKDNKNLNPNSYTVSIEVYGYPGDNISDAAYNSIIEILRSLNIKLTRYNLIGHYQVNPTNKPNCGIDFNYDRILAALVTPAPQPQNTPPQGFDEEAYRFLNPDVDRAVREGLFPSGLNHYQRFGVNENRLFTRKDMDAQKALQDQLAQKDALIGQKDQAYISLEALKKSVDEQNTLLTQQNTELHKQLTAKEEEITIRLSDMKKENDDKIKGLESKVTELSNRVGELLAINEKKEAEIVVLKQEKSDRDIKIEGLEKAVKEYQGKHVELSVSKVKLFNLPSLGTKFMHLWMKMPRFLRYTLPLILSSLGVYGESELTGLVHKVFDDPRIVALLGMQVLVVENMMIAYLKLLGTSYKAFLNRLPQDEATQ